MSSQSGHEIDDGNGVGVIVGWMGIEEGVAKVLVVVLVVVTGVDVAKVLVVVLVVVTGVGVGFEQAVKVVCLFSTNSE